jgi:hypothetical protein
MESEQLKFRSPRLFCKIAITAPWRFSPANATDAGELSARLQRPKLPIFGLTRRAYARIAAIKDCAPMILIARFMLYTRMFERRQ